MGKKVSRVLEIDKLYAIQAQLAALLNQLSCENSQTMGQVVVLEAEGKVEGVQLINNNIGYIFRLNNDISIYYHPSLKNHENFSYENQKNALIAPPGFAYSRTSNYNN